MQVGDPIVLTLTLWDRSETKFVKVVLSGDGVVLSGTPVSVPHLVSGEYYFIDKINLTFPENIFEIKASYTVYNDAGFTDQAAEYAPAEDKYRLNTSDSASEIAAIADSLRLIDGEIEMEVEEDEIEVTLLEEENIEFEIVL